MALNGTVSASGLWKKRKSINVDHNIKSENETIQEQIYSIIYVYTYRPY